MSYEPTNWKTGDVVTSAKLNKLEQGVADAGGAFKTLLNFNAIATWYKSRVRVYYWSILTDFLVDEDTPMTAAEVAVSINGITENFALALGGDPANFSTLPDGFSSISVEFSSVEAEGGVYKAQILIHVSLSETSEDVEPTGSASGELYTYSDKLKALV